MNRFALLFALVFTLIAAPAVAQSSLVDEIAEAHGSKTWDDVKRVKFTWKHEPSGTERTYDWNIEKSEVVVTIGETTVTVPVVFGRFKGKELEAHKAFVNDSYWLLFETVISQDKVELQERGEVEVPGFGKKARALAVQYGDGGYTPGDAFVLYAGKDGKVFAWAYHPAGAEKPRVVTTRANHKTFGKLVVPTHFDTADGKRFITISNVEITF